MSRAPGSRQRALVAALVATLAASWWALVDDAGDAASARASTQRPVSEARPSPKVVDGTLAPGSVTPGPDAAPELPARAGPGRHRRDLFAAYGRPPAPPNTAASVASPQPQPPPLTLPFGFGGRLITADSASVLLSQGGQTLVLAVGEQLGDFRLEHDRGSQLEFVHVPTDERLVLATSP